MPCAGIIVGKKAVLINGLLALTNSAHSHDADNPIFSMCFLFSEKGKDHIIVWWNKWKDAQFPRRKDAECNRKNGLGEIKSQNMS